MNSLMYFNLYENDDPTSYTDYVYAGKIEGDDYSSLLRFNVSRLHDFMNGFNEKDFKYFLKLSLDYYPSFGYLNFSIYLGSYLVYSHRASNDEHEDITLDLTSYFNTFYYPGCVNFFYLNFVAEVEGSTTSQGTIYPSSCYVRIGSEKNSNSNAIPEFYIRDLNYNYTKEGFPLTSYQLSDCGAISFDTFNKNIQYSNHLFNVDAIDLSFPFILMYDNHYKRNIITRPNVFNLPSGWYTSFDMFFIRKDGYSELLGDKGITLINEYGRRVEFNQRWYYIGLEGRHYVNVSELTVYQGDVVLSNNHSQVCVYEIVSESGMIFVDKTTTKDAYITYQNGLKLYFDDNCTLKSITNMVETYKIQKEGSYIKTYKNNSLITSQVHVDIQDQEISCDFGTDLYKRFSYNLSSGKISSISFYRDDNDTGTVSFVYNSDGTLSTISDDNYGLIEVTYLKNDPSNIKFKSGITKVGYENHHNDTPSIKSNVDLSYFPSKTIVTDTINNLSTSQLFDYDSSIIKEVITDLDNSISSLISSKYETNKLNKAGLTLNNLSSNQIYEAYFNNDNSADVLIGSNTLIPSNTLNYLEGLTLELDLSSFNKNELIFNVLNLNIRLYNGSTQKHIYKFNYYVQENEKIYIPFVFVKDSNKISISYSLKRNVTTSLQLFKIYKSESKLGLINERGLVGDSFSNDSYIHYEYNDDLEKVRIINEYDKSGNFNSLTYTYNSLGQIVYVLDNYNNLEERNYDSYNRLCYVSKRKSTDFGPVHYFNKITYNTSGRPVNYSLQKNASTGTYDTSYNTYYNTSNVLKETKLFNGNYTIHDIDSHTGNTYRYRYTSQLWDRTNYKYKNGMLKQLSSYSEYNRIGYTYDCFGRTIKVTLPNNGTITKTYTDNYNNSSLGITNGTLIDTLSTLTSQTKEYYTKDSKLKRIKRGTNKNIDFTYDSKDRLVDIESKLSGVTDEHVSIQYDNLGRIHDTYVLMHGVNMHNVYNYVSSATGNSKGKLYSKATSVTGTTISETYGYDDEGKTTNINASDIKTQYVYNDNLNRLTEVGYSDINDNGLFGKEYTYYTDVRDSETNHLPLVHYLNNIINNASQYTFGYKYDTTGNIVEETMLESPNTTKIAKQYTYDTHNRIILEKDMVAKLSTHYTYNENGNLTSKILYALSNTGSELFVLETKNFTYNTSSNWRDQLINDSLYNYTYDSLGRPENYLSNTISYDNYNNISSIGSNIYTYNNAGIRLTKIENGYKHLYYYDGSRLIKEEVLNANTNEHIRTLVFIYNNNEIIGFKLDGVLYYYVKNLTGDVIFIYRSNNTKIAEYSYNAFGQTTIQYNVDNIANINPFRYKSYYYDNETGLYYLISRYYSPALMRFLTPDSIKYIDPNQINGVNLYVYCGNNPIMCSDPEGCLAITLSMILTTAIIGFISGSVVGGVAGGLIAAANGTNVGYGILAGILAGGITGAGAAIASLFIAPVIAGEGVMLVTAAGTNFYMGVTISSSIALSIGIGISLVSGAIGGGVNEIVGQLLNEHKISNWKSVGISALESGILNVFSGFLGGFVGVDISNFDNLLVTTMLNKIPTGFGVVIDIIRNALKKRRENE